MNLASLNIAKHMESIFVVAITLACAAAFAAAPAPVRESGAPAALGGVAKVPTVTVTAKRMTAAEKARFDQQ